MPKEIDKLHLILLNKDEEEAREYIKNNEIDINKQTIDGSSYLHCAVEANLLSMVELLLDMGADINIQDVYGKTPVMLALGRDRTEGKQIVQYLLDRGADASIPTYGGIEAKEFATRIGLSESIIQRL